MSAPKPSSTGTVSPAQRFEVGGTSFLDLPPELRVMIYDLCAPEIWATPYYVPFQAKPAVTGLNLLQCSKQIHNEVSPRLRLWDSSWILRVESATMPQGTTTSVDCSFLMSSLPGVTLARITKLQLSFLVDASTHATFGVYGLRFLLKMKSLRSLTISLMLWDIPLGNAIQQSSDLENLPFVTGLVIRVLSHVPLSVSILIWGHFTGASSGD